MTPISELRFKCDDNSLNCSSLQAPLDTMADSTTMGLAPVSDLKETDSHETPRTLPPDPACRRSHCNPHHRADEVCNLYHRPLNKARFCATSSAQQPYPLFTQIHRIFGAWGNFGRWIMMIMPLAPVLPSRPCTTPRTSAWMFTSMVRS